MKKKLIILHIKGLILFMTILGFGKCSIARYMVSYIYQCYIYLINICNNKQVFTVTFNQFNVSLLDKNLTKKTQYTNTKKLSARNHLQKHCSLCLKCDFGAFIILNAGIKTTPFEGLDIPVAVSNIFTGPERELDP